MPEPDPPAKEPESLERQFVRWVYRDHPEQLPYKPASLERRSLGPGNLPPISRVLSALTNAGCEWKPSSTDVDSWAAQCPTHDDASPSLHVRRNPDGSVWIKDWSGLCTKEQILHTLGLEWRDLFESAEYDYGRDKPHVKPLLPPHLRRAMEDMLRRDDERRAR